MRSIKLTVAIPTYNRNQLLSENIELLLPQLHENVELLIVDNCSTVPVEETILARLTQSGVQFRIIRNAVNIGANGNIARCLELAYGEFVWLLGDDDKVTNNAIEVVLADISAEPSLHFISYFSEGTGHLTRPNNHIVKGQLELLQNCGGFGQLIFISTCVFNRSAIAKGLHLANFYQNTCAPQLVVLLTSMTDSSISLLSKELICKNGADLTPLDQKPSVLPIALGFDKVLELPVTTKVRAQLRAMLTATQDGWITAEAVILDLYVMSFFHGRKVDALFFYHRLRTGFFRYPVNRKTAFVLKCGWFFIRWPRFFQARLNNLYFQRRGENLEQRAKRSVFGRL